jgi:hypothetical protein
MSKEIIMQFMGFASKAEVREYTFTVREAAIEPREFTVSIANEAFNQHRLRFQDAPDVCSLKLKRELATYANHPPESHFHITNDELEDYRSSHTAPRRSMFARRPTEDY